MSTFETRVIAPYEPITDAQQVRIKVFQEEQGISAELDFDGRDNIATHVVVYHQEKPVGTGRMRKIDNKTVKIERVAVLSEMRGHGIGKLIMQTMNDYLSGTEVEIATLDAQHHAKGFYDNLGYTQEGEIFEEVGIPHVVMVKRFK